MVQSKVQLDGSLLSRVCRPREHLQTQRHHAGIDTQQSILEPKLRLLSQLCSAAFRGLIKNIPEQFPWPVFVGVRECRSFGYFYPELLQTPITAGQSSSYLS